MELADGEWPPGERLGEYMGTTEPHEAFTFYIGKQLRESRSERLWDDDQKYALQSMA